MSMAFLWRNSSRPLTNLYQSGLLSSWTHSIFSV